MRVTETVPVSDTYCSGISKIEKLPCGNLRIWCFTQQGSECGEGPVENVLVAKLVLPLSAVPAMIQLALEATGIDLAAISEAAVNLFH